LGWNYICLLLVAPVSVDLDGRVSRYPLAPWA
jgi:hypothetical protein